MQTVGLGGVVMQKQTEWALEFVKQIQKLYFEDRNLNKVAQYFAPDITWIGFGKGEICHNIEEAQRFFHAETGGVSKFSMI